MTISNIKSKIVEFIVVKILKPRMYMEVREEDFTIFIAFNNGFNLKQHYISPYKKWFVTDFIPIISRKK